MFLNNLKKKYAETKKKKALKDLTQVKTTYLSISNNEKKVLKKLPANRGESYENEGIHNAEQEAIHCG